MVCFHAAVYHFILRTSCSVHHLPSILHLPPLYSPILYSLPILHILIYHFLLNFLVWSSRAPFQSKFSFFLTLFLYTTLYSACSSLCTSYRIDHVIYSILFSLYMFSYFFCCVPHAHSPCSSLCLPFTHALSPYPVTVQCSSVPHAHSPCLSTLITTLPLWFPFSSLYVPLLHSACSILPM